MDNIIREIGSEFWKADNTLSKVESPIWNKYNGEKRFFVSGRTALYEIISDIKKSASCKKAYLPSYCCESMVEPFFRHNISVDFYDVYLDDGIKTNINPNQKCDIILTVDYFGYSFSPVELPKAIHIHDVTHSLLSSPSYTKADYYFASFRKWDAVAGAGFACKFNGGFLTEAKTSEHTKYLDMRNLGYSLKAQYISSGNGNKQEFLSLFNQAEELLDSDYIGYCADKESLFIASALKKQTAARKSNALSLTSALKNCRLVKPIFSKISPDDVPLFVPVIVKNNLRNQLKSYLIENSIYCPVHWPIHDGRNGELYESELSLICDQRYSSLDIQREIDLILAFVERFVTI